MAHSACFHNRFVHVLEPAAAVKLARSASRPAVNSGACVTAICLLFLFGSFWTLSVAHRAQSITRCRMLRLCRKHHGARASILQKHFLQQMLSKLLCHKGNHLSMEMKKLISICDCIISIIATTAVPGFVTVTCNAALRYVLAGVTLQLTRRFQTLLHLKQSHTYKSEHLLFYSVVLEHAATSSGIASTSSSGIASAISYSLASTISSNST